MNFEKEFPSLKGMGCGCIITNRPNGIRRQDQTYQQIDVQKHCLDKQRVLEAIEKEAKTWEYETWSKKLKKELGLE